MNHDPLCMWSTNAKPDPLPGYDCGECDQIAKVRADERAAAGDRVAALLSGDFYGTAGFLMYFGLYRKYVIAAASDDREGLRALQEKP